jgi:hypothetical protein
MSPKQRLTLREQQWRSVPTSRGWRNFGSRTDRSGGQAKPAVHCPLTAGIVTGPNVRGPTKWLSAVFSCPNENPKE